MFHPPDDAPVARPKLADLVEVLGVQLPDALLLGEELLQSVPLLLVHLQFIELFHQHFQVRAHRRGGSMRKSFKWMDGWVDGRIDGWMMG